ncbi:MAG: hypothetical protein WCO64_07920 [Actinomycetes bacterium]
MSTDDKPVAGVPVTPTITINTPKTKQAMSMSLVVALTVATLGLGFGVGRYTAPQPKFGARGTMTGGGNFPRPIGSGAPNFGGPDAGGVNPNGAGNPGGGMRMRGAPELAGTVTAVTGSTITVTLDRGTVVTLSLGSGTVVSQKTTGSAGDIIPGAKITVGLPQDSIAKLFGAGNGSNSIDVGQATSVTVTK